MNTRKTKSQNAASKEVSTSSKAQLVGATSHTNDFNSIKVIANIERGTRIIIEEAIETEKQPNNLNTLYDTQPATTYKFVLNSNENNIYSNDTPTPPKPTERNHRTTT